MKALKTDIQGADQEAVRPPADTARDLYLPAACGVAATLLVILLLLRASDLVTVVMLVVFYLLLCAVIGFSIKNLRQINQVMLRQAESEKKAVEAELEQKRQQLLALESQINPHFLYNTLDTFRGVAMEDGNRKLSDMIEALSVMFKYSVNYEAEMVNINAELNYLSKYIQLQQLRFPERFVVQEDINCTPEQLLLEHCPRFVLQPLVENALQHGLKNMRRGGCITIAMEIRHNDFYILVEDNGCGMSQTQAAQLNQRLARPEEAAKAEEATKKEGQRVRHGIGLANVNKRIKMFCGEEYGLKVISAPDVGTQIEVCLPLYHEARRGNR